MRRRNLLLAIVVLLVLWQVASLIVNEPILPGPITVGQAFFEEITGDLAVHFLYSTARVLASVILAVALAAPAGLILGQSERLDQIFSPFVCVYALPHTESCADPGDPVTFWSRRPTQNHHYLSNLVLPDPGTGP